MSLDLMIKKITTMNNPSVAGLDPVLDYVPGYIQDKNFEIYGKNLKGASEAIWEFNKGLIDALCDVVPAVKPQSAFYEMYGLHGMEVLDRTIKYAKGKGLYVILDVKRNDIGSTAAAYSAAYLGRTMVSNEMYAASPVDCVTVNPYLGTDGIKPFIDDCKKYDKGIFVLVKTSNPSSGDLQDLIINDETIYQKAGALVRKWGADTVGDYGYSAVGAVVGATYPQQAKVLRELMPNTYFLVPGYGAQGGSAKDVKNCFNKDGLGAIVNSSRGIMCAYKKGDYAETDFAQAARNEAIRMKNELNSIL